MSKILETLCDDFKAYLYKAVASIESDKATRQEQVFFDEHQRKSMDFVDRLGDLLAKPQPIVPAQILTNDRFADKQLDLLSGSVRSIREVLKNPDLIDTHVLSNYMERIKSRGGAPGSQKGDTIT